MSKRSALQSFKYAAEGIKYVVKTQKNMKRCVLVSIAFLLTGYALCLSSIELVLLCIPITFLLLAEMFNTAAEVTLDLSNGKTYNPIVKIVKDITAGAVLIALTGLCISAGVMFINHIPVKAEWFITARNLYAKFFIPPATIMVCLSAYVKAVKK